MSIPFAQYQRLLHPQQNAVLLDSHGRHITYLRLAVTDRCNLRCHYCMPAAGLDWSPRKELLTYEEILRLLFIFKNLGITRLRFTGGEPFLRKDFMALVRKVVAENWFEQIAITTNGTLTSPFVSELKLLGIHAVNLSLDTLDKQRFGKMTRRDDFDAVMETLHRLIESGIRTKVNAVIMEGHNAEDLIPLAGLTKQHPIDVRFIEEMPFNGKGDSHAMRWNYVSIVEALREVYPDLQKIIDAQSSTSYNYHVPGHAGNLGVIAAWSRSFCGTCNRVRLTPAGKMKTCLYDDGTLSLRDMLRQGADDATISSAITEAIRHKAPDGQTAEKLRSPVKESMATIGG